MNNTQQNKLLKRQRRLIRTRAKFLGRGVPRLCAFRSLKHFYLQIIDDNAGRTLCAASDHELKLKNKKPIEVAAAVGAAIAEKAVAKKITKVVFDRGAYKYHGRVKAAADAARTGGLKF